MKSNPSQHPSDPHSFLRFMNLFEVETFYAIKMKCVHCSMTDTTIIDKKQEPNKGRLLKRLRRKGRR